MISKETIQFISMIISLTTGFISIFTFLRRLVKRHQKYSLGIFGVVCILSGGYLLYLYIDAFPVKRISDDFSAGLEKWSLYGTPSPQLQQLVYGKADVFDNNGFPYHPSGAVSKKLVKCNDGCSIESDVYLDFSNKEGCWAAAAIGITKKPYPNGNGFTGEYADGAYFAIAADGDACWMTPATRRRHAYFWAGFYTEDGATEEMPKWSDEAAADAYANGWHKLKILIEKDRTVKFFIDGDLVWQPANKINKAVLEGRNIVLGSRSSGSAGKAYHDWVRVSPL